MHVLHRIFFLELQFHTLLYKRKPENRHEKNSIPVIRVKSILKKKTRMIKAEVK